MTHSADDAGFYPSTLESVIASSDVWFDYDPDSFLSFLPLNFICSPFVPYLVLYIDLVEHRRNIQPTDMYLLDISERWMYSNLYMLWHLSFNLRHSIGQYYLNSNALLVAQAHSNAMIANAYILNENEKWNGHDQNEMRSTAIFIWALAKIGSSSWAVVCMAFYFNDV